MARTKSKRRRSREDKIMDTIIYILSIIILFMTVYPFYYVFMLSFNEGIDASLGGIYWFPRKFTLSNYSRFFDDVKWLQALGVSVLRTLIGTGLGVAFTTLVAYALSFKDLVGRKAYMTFVIFCMYFSGGIIPYYTLLRTLHLIDTFAVYVIPGMLSLFYITIGRTFFEGIPSALRESAKIDGANRWQQTWHVTLPGMKMIIVLMLVLSLGNVLNAGFDQVFNLYNVSVYESGDILDTFVYRLGLLNAQYGPATAVGLFKSFVSTLFISVSYFLAYKFGDYRIF